MLPLYKSSRSRGGIYIDRPSCRSYLEGVISTTTRHTYTWENNVIGEGVPVPPPLMLKFLLSPLFLSSSSTLLFLLLPRERKIRKRKKRGRRKEINEEEKEGEEKGE